MHTNQNAVFINTVSKTHNEHPKGNPMNQVPDNSKTKLQQQDADDNKLVKSMTRGVISTYGLVGLCVVLVLLALSFFSNL